MTTGLVDTAGLDRDDVARLRDKMTRYAAAVLGGAPLDDGDTLDGVFDRLADYHRTVRRLDAASDSPEEGR